MMSRGLSSEKTKTVRTGWSPDLAEPVIPNFENRGMGKLEMTKAELLIRARAPAKVLAAKSTMPLAGAEACLEQLSGIPVDDRLSSFQQCLTGLSIEERHYWIGTLYTLMLPAKVRRSQAAYFTSPLVAGAVVELAIDAGFDFEKDDVLDSAAGAAAFLSTLVGRMTVAGVKHEDVARRLNGIDIDEGFARLAQRLIEERLGAKLLQEIIVIGDALVTPFEAAYDLVIAHPPYGPAWPETSRRRRRPQGSFRTRRLEWTVRPGAYECRMIFATFPSSPVSLDSWTIRPPGDDRRIPGRPIPRSENVRRWDSRSRSRILAEDLE